MSFKQAFGIDPGTDTIKIYDFKDDTITVEKNLIAVKDHNTVLCAGDDAYEFYNRVSADTIVTSPMYMGRIGDVRFAEAIIHFLLRKQGHYIGRRPLLYFAVPCDMTEIERRAYTAIARRGKLRNCSVYLIEKPISDALALGIPTSKSKGSMMINIGAETTTLSSTADSHVILNRSVPYGGKQINEGIVSMVRRINRLHISEKTAEDIKLAITGTKDPDFRGVTVSGIDTENGLPRTGFVTKTTGQRAVYECISAIIKGLNTFIERTPPQIRKTISEEGIYLTGGGARIPGIDRELSSALGYPIHLSSLYEYSTVSGLKEVIKFSGANKLAYDVYDNGRTRRRKK